MLRTKRSLMSFVLMIILLVPILVACGGTTATEAPAPTTGASAATEAPPAAATEAPPAAATEAPPAAATEAPPAAATEAPTEAATEAPPASGSGTDMDKTIIIGITQEPDTLFGIESQSSATTQVLEAIQPTCVTTLDYEYQPVCFTELPSFENGGIVTETVDVDSNYENPVVINDELITDTSTISEPMQLDQTTVTWTLVDGLTWEDGEPLTADDFVFGYELANDPNVQIAVRFTNERTASLEATDDKTIVWKGVPGFTDATAFLNFAGSTGGPYPRHAMEGQTIEDWRSMNPLSFGPYKLAENVPAESTTLVANDTYWRADEGLPKVGNIVFKYLTSEDQVLQQLEGGEIDVVGQIGLTLAQAPNLDDLEASGQVEAQYVPATVWEHIDFTVERGDGEPSLFDDVKVRQAIAYGVNREEIIKEVLFGKTVEMNTFLPADHWAYPPNGEGLETYAYDPDKAGQLLDEAGWTMGADGIREKDGRKLQPQFFTTEGNTTRQAVAQIVQENLKQIGVDMVLNFVPGTAVLFKNGEDGILSARKFDMAMYAWVSGPEPSTALYRCDQIPTPENNYAGQNNTGWCNEEYTKLALEEASELDRAKRTDLVIQAEKIFNAELPTFPLYQRVNVAASRSVVSGLAINPTSQIDFYNIAEWDIQK